VDAIDDAATVLRFTSPLRPGLICGPGDDFTYLIMPIRLSS
jgi:DNA polymerase III sliding clamp (beta) subunit (PCNA family)